MSKLHILYHLARADVLERIRRYSFLIMLATAVFLGSQIAVNNLSLQMDAYRGVFNSAWVGSLMALMGTFFFGWFGFYLVKGSIARDRETGVGQIVAATPISRTTYLLGKWVSHIAILLILNLILVGIGVGIQFLAGESRAFNLWHLLAPFVLITLPTMALVAATAVFFESVNFLRGSLGNVFYFFLFIFAADSLDKSQIAYGFDPTGIGILRRSLWAAAKAAYPHFDGGFVIDIQARLEPVRYIFDWSGVTWTSQLVLQRLALIGVGLVLLIIAAAFFDRFEAAKSSQPGLWKVRKRKPKLAESTAPAVAVATPMPLTPLKPTARRFSFITLLNTELKLLLKAPRKWWYVVALALIVAGGIAPPALTQSTLLPFAWIWPITLWSSMGNRKLMHSVHQIAFSSAFPLWRQLPAQWLAGFLVTFGLGFGAFLSILLGGELTDLLTFFSAALFIPSLALASGVWSQSNKLFEVLYLFIWYFGPMNHLLGLDFIGTQGNGRPAIFIPLSLLLMMMAIWGRKRQVSS